MQAKTVRMRADAKQLVDGKLYLSGDFFMATPQDAEDLVAVRFATIVPAATPERPILRQESRTFWSWALSAARSAL